MRKLASDSLVYGLGSVANQALSIILLPLYTRTLTPADYGSLALIGAAGSVLSLTAALGINSGMMRIFFTYDDPNDRRAVVFTALVFGAATASFVCLALTILAPWLAPLVFDFEGGLTYFRFATFIFSLAAVNLVAIAVLQAYQRPRPYIVSSLVGLLASLGLTIYLVAVAGRGVMGVLEGQLVGIIVQLALALSFCAKEIRPLFRSRTLRQMLAFSAPLLPTNLSAWALGLADRYVLKSFATLTEVGLYSLGFRFGTVLDTLFVRPFQQAWSPFLFSNLNAPGYREMCARVLEYYLFLGGSIVLGLALFAGDVIRAIADPSYFSAERVVYWIGLGTLLRGTTTITVASIHIEQKTHYSAFVFGGAVALNIALLWCLVPRYGMMGAAYATVVTYAGVVCAFLWIAERLHPIPYHYGKMVLLVGLMTALALLGRLVPAEPLLLGLAEKLLLLAAFPALLLLFRFFGAEDVRRARAFLGSRSSARA
jgi:O-antigen/teichoic acid export membrane protein